MYRACLHLNQFACLLSNIDVLAYSLFAKSGKPILPLNKFEINFETAVHMSLLKYGTINTISHCSTEIYPIGPLYQRIVVAYYTWYSNICIRKVIAETVLEYRFFKYTKVRPLFLTHSHLMPSLVVKPFEFLDELFIPKTRVLALFFRENFVILVCVVFTQCQRMTDRQTDGQTNHPIVANTGLCKSMKANTHAERTVE